MRRLAVILLLLCTAACSPWRRIEVESVGELRTEHLQRLSVQLTLNNRTGRRIALQQASGTVSYRGRQMCRLHLRGPVSVGAHSVECICPDFDMTVLDMATLSAFSRTWERDSRKAISLTSIDGTAEVKFGSMKRKLVLGNSRSYENLY